MTEDDGAGEPFDILLRVQDLDTTVAQAQRRKVALPVRAELASLRARLASARARTDDALARRQALVDRQAEIERQVAALNARRQAVETRLYSARGSAARDLQAMNDEVQHLVQRRSDLEDVELEVMGAQEPIDAELVGLQADLASIEASTAAVAAELTEADAVIDRELAGLSADRQREAALLPDSLRTHYETLRTRLGGTGAARLVGNRCEGCHLELPAVERERIRRLPRNQLVTCDQCGRILVRPAGSGGA